MTFDEIIDENVKHYGERARHAYHYTDVTNAVNIVSAGAIFSRNEAIRQNLMRNKNADEGVVNLNELAHNYARLYFRPKTPTQYHNEGYKHTSFRMSDPNSANVPVPVFFVFDLKKLLANPNVQFVPRGLAGTNPNRPIGGVENFSKLEFQYIYHKSSLYGYDDETKRDIIKLRHTELVVPNELELEPYLEKIVFRNEIELQTFVTSLLTINPIFPLNYIAEKFFVDANDAYELFMRNGIFIQSLEYEPMTKHFTINFSNPNANDYGRYEEKKINLKFALLSSTQRFEKVFEINLSQRNFTVRIASVNFEDFDFVQIFFEDSLMCYVPITENIFAPKPKVENNVPF